MMLNKIPGFWRVKQFKRNFPKYIELFKNEYNNSSNIPWSRKLRSYKNGFLSKSYVIYDLENNKPENYLSDYARIINTAHINKEFTYILANKLVFHSVLRQFDMVCPKLYALVRNKKIYLLPKSDITEKTKTLSQLVMAYTRLVVKPASGGGGSDIFIIKYRNDAFFLNEKLIDRSVLDKMIFGELNGFLIEEYIEQADYSAAIFSGTTNTIRLLTMWDEEENKVFIAAAVHRFGTRDSEPVDNWTQGGLVAKIDMETGMLSNAITHPHCNKMYEKYDHHPDSGNMITDVSIPDWSIIKNKMIEISSCFPFVPYIGWDILIDKKNTLKIIEGNHRSGVNIIQPHYPLLKNERIKKFYQYHNVIP